MLLESYFVYSAFYYNHCLQRSHGGEWTKLLLLLAGDIERNPGPGIGKSGMPHYLATIIHVVWSWCCEPYTDTLVLPCYATDQTPGLPDLINFKGKTRKINIATEIGTKYKFVGITLLNDHRGEKVAAIHHKCMRDLEETNLEILRYGFHPQQAHTT